MQVSYTCKCKNEPLSISIATQASLTAAHCIHSEHSRPDGGWRNIKHVMTGQQRQGLLVAKQQVQWVMSPASTSVIWLSKLAGWASAACLSGVVGAEGVLLMFCPSVLLCEVPLERCWVDTWGTLAKCGSNAAAFCAACKYIPIDLGPTCLK